MSVLDRITPCQIGDGARQLEDAVLGACGELQLVHG
jgi:hypothetical protein